MTKNIKIFIYLIFYHREIVKLDHFIMTLSLSYANTVLWRSRCKIHRFVAAPLQAWGKNEEIMHKCLGHKSIVKRTTVNATEYLYFHSSTPLQNLCFVYL